MSITSGGKSYNPAYPVANINNNTKGFRDNFATIKFAIENLQSASSGSSAAAGLSSNGSVLKLTASPDLATGAVQLKAEFNSTGFRLPMNRPTAPATGMICYEDGVLYFYNGSTWQNFIARSGDTVTLTNLVVNGRLSLNFAPTNPTDAVTKQWVENYVSTLATGGTDPMVYARLDTIESDLSQEITARVQEDNAIRALIDTERARIDGNETRFSVIDQELVQVRNDLGGRMDGVENLANQVAGDFANLSQAVENAVQQVGALAQQVDNDIATERAERIAADEALSARLDNFNDVVLADFASNLEAERQARIAADNSIQQGLTQTNEVVSAERSARIAAVNSQNSTINALTAAFNQANAIVMSVGDRIDQVAADLVAEKTNREAGDINERNARIAADNAERQAREQAIQQQQQALAAETAARQQESQQHQQALADETAARQTAISAERSAREQAIADEATARQDAISTEQSAREQAVSEEATARQQAIATETAARNAAIASEATARQQAIEAETNARSSAVATEKSQREAADANLQAQIDALETAQENNDYLSKSIGGAVTAPVTFGSDVTVSGGSLTLQNAEFYLPGSNITIDADHALFFSKLPNTVGSGDGAFITFEENNFRYAFLTPAERLAQEALGDEENEFACLRIASTNDAPGMVGDSVAIEAAAHLYLNPGWQGGFDSSDRNEAPGAFVFIGDALTWKVQISRDTGNIVTKGRIDADGDVVGLSDESVKDNVERITGALDKIAALTGVLYDRTDVEGSPRQMGLIAQEVQPIVPEVVHEREDGKLGIAYSNLIGLLIEGIKELREEVQSLKK